MAIDTSLPFPYQFLHDERGQHIPPPIPSHDPNHTNCNNINAPDLKPQVLLIPREFRSPTTPLSQQDNLVPDMPHFMLQDDTKFDSSSIGSDHLESLWDSVSSPQSTLSSTLSSIQGSPEGSSQEPSPKSYDFCWDSTYDVVEMLEKMKLHEKDSSKYHPGYGNHRLETSNVGVCSLLQEQIQLSRIRQEQILSQKQKLTAYRGKNNGQITQQFQKKGKGVDDGCDNRWRTRPPWHSRSHQQAGSTGTSCGTGVFLPRGRTSAPFESRKRPGKGCSTVLIPARVVQALQLHFEQMAATSGPKPGGFPPLHDVLVSNRDGMYSLQKHQSRDKPARIQNEMILPHEWTY